MTVPLHKPVTCPVLIGRAAHVEALDRALHEVASGRGQTLLISGEAGIGKSRLVAEARTRAEQLGFLVLEGHCFEPDRSLPYAPLLDLLRAHLTGRSAEEVAQLFGAAAPELAKLLPELGTRLPDLTPSPALEPEAEKRRLFRTLAQLLIDLAGTQPGIMIVEDLHWADDLSLEFLLQLARRIRPAPILLLLTYRDDEAHPALSHFLAQLDRERLAAEVTLARLSSAETDAMLRAIFELDRPVRSEFLEAMYELTEGNPFFVEEVLKSLVSAGDIWYAGGAWDRKPLAQLRIPRTVEDAVRRRVEPLSGAARDTLRLAAVAGERFDVALLRELVRQDERELLRQIKELITAQLVVEESAERMAFRHALTRRAVYAQLLALERRTLHRQVAEATERVFAADLAPHLNELSYYFYEAGAWAKAMGYGRQAGERAQAMFAPRAAVEHFTRVVEAAEALGMSPAAAVLRSRGQAYETLGEFNAARADHEAGLRMARAAGDRRAEWQARLDLGSLWASRDYARTGEYSRQALALAREIGDAALVAHSLNRVGNLHLNVEQPLEASAYYEEALRMFRAVDDRPGIAESLDLLGMAVGVGGDVPRAASHLDEAAALFRELGDRQGLASSLAALAFCAGCYEAETLVTPTSFQAFIQKGEEALDVARTIGWRSGEAFALVQLAVALGPRGDYGRALELARRAKEVAEEIEHSEWLAGAHYALGTLQLDLLALAPARTHLEQARAIADRLGSVHWSRLIAASLASVYVLLGELPRAEGVLDAVLGADGLSSSPVRIAWCSRAELELARGQPGVALDIADRLVASAPNVSGERAIPRLWHVRGEALAALGRTGESRAALLAAAEGAAAHSYHRLSWRIQVTLGTLYRAEGRREEAEQAFAAARATVEALAAGIPDAALGDGFLRAALGLIPAPRPLTPLRAAKREFGGLTTREREVAALIAQGKSNRAIAEELVLSERTIATHVTNMLAKLGLRSRAHIAAWAVERGLGRPATS